MNRKSNLDAILQICLEQVLEQGKPINEVLIPYSQYEEEIRPLLESAVWLEQQSHRAELSEERLIFKKKELLNQIQREEPQSSISKRKVLPTFHWKYSFKPMFQWAIILIVFLCSLTGGVAWAAQSSIPGDALYPIKTSSETIRFNLTKDPFQQEQLLLEFSQRRLVECEALLADGREKDATAALILYKNELDSLNKILFKTRPLITQSELSQYKKYTQEQLNLNAQQIHQIVQKISTEQNYLAQEALVMTEMTRQSLLQTFDELNHSRPTLTSTPTPSGVPSETLSSELPNSGSSTSVSSSVPPGLLKKTEVTLETETPSVTSIIGKPSKTPRPTATIKPPNTHKPPNPPTPVKPTKKPKT